MLLLVPGRRRISGASLPRAASISILLVASSVPVVLVAGCGQPPIVRHYHLDRLGTTQVVTDYNGNIYRQMRYYAYGEVRARFNGAGNPVSGVASDARYEFTGYETDAFSGLDYAGARFYDPELGQFQSHDPKRQFASPYAYGPGDPINGTDPTGEDFGISLLIIALIAAAAAFLDSYLSTGDWGMALASAGLAFVGTYVGAGVGLVINMGLEAAKSTVLTLTVRAAQVGYAAYGVRDGLANGRPFSAGVAIGQLAYGLRPGSGEGGKTASGDPPKNVDAESDDWIGAGLPDSAIVKPGATKTIADQNHGTRIVIEAHTPTTIPTEPPPTIELDLRLTFAPDYGKMPDTLDQGVTVGLTRTIPAEPNKVVELFNRSVAPIVKEPLARPLVEVNNTGNVPVKVRVRSEIDLRAAR